MKRRNRRIRRARLLHNTRTYFYYTLLLTLRINVRILAQVKLEWDDNKRNKTLAERGVDFADVALVDWNAALTAEDVRADDTETRLVTMAPISGRLCVFAWCWRGAALRVISLRKANDREQKRYAEAIRQS